MMIRLLTAAVNLNNDDNHLIKFYIETGNDCLGSMYELIVNNIC